MGHRATVELKPDSVYFLVAATIHLFQSTVILKPEKHKTHFHAKSTDVHVTFESQPQSNYIYIITLITLGQERHILWRLLRGRVGDPGS